MTATIKFDKWVYLLISLENKNNPPMNHISENLGITYAHVFRLLKDMEKRGWIKTRIDGRARMVELTDKGREIKLRLKPLIGEV